MDSGKNLLPDIPILLGNAGFRVQLESYYKAQLAVND